MITIHQKYFNLFLQLGVQGVTGSSGRSSTGRAGRGLGRSGGWADRPLQGHGESWLVSNSLKWGVCNSMLAIDCKLQTKLLWTCFGPPFLPRSGKHLFEYFYLFFFLLGEGTIFWLSSCSSVIVTTWETFFLFISQLFKFTFHSLVPGHRSTVKAQHTQEQQSVGVVLVQLEVGLMDLQRLYNNHTRWSTQHWFGEKLPTENGQSTKATCLPCFFNVQLRADKTKIQLLLWLPHLLFIV